MVQRLIAGLAALCALVLFLAPAPEGVGEGVMRAGAVAVLTIGLLATVALPEALTVLIFFLLAVVLPVAAPAVVFSGFASGAVWLVFGGLILGTAIEQTGLGARFAGTLERLFAASYPRVVTGTVAMLALLAFIMPSSVGRVTVMMPIVLALAERLGFGPESNGRAGLALAVALGSLTPTLAILPASVPNVALAGAAEAIHGITFSYSEYLLLHFPVIGLVSILALPPLILLLFPDRIARREAAPPAPKPLSGGERRLLAILLAALALWATDTVHGVKPAWVSLGAGIACMLPRAGMLAPATVLPRLNFAPVLMLAGVIGLGAVVADSGLGRAVGEGLLRLLPLSPEGGFGDFLSLIGLGVVMGWVTTLPGLPAIMTSFADTLAGATGWPLLAVLMAQVPAYALIMFPYQAPPLVASKALSGLPVSAFLRLMIPFAAFGWLVMVPLTYAWWRVLGFLP